MDLNSIKRQTTEAAEQLIVEAVNSHADDIFVLGCSSSEVKGGVIGKASSKEIGEVIIEALLTVCDKHGFNLAVQGCEHINRVLIVERSVMIEKNLCEVNVIPQLDAGGSAAVAAFANFEDPVCVEFIEASLGLDIGDTEIGMHVKHVQRPVRVQTSMVGEARVTGLMYRPKLIGGDRSRHK